MKDYLQDLVSHTFDLGHIDLIKITGDENETIINAVTDSKSVVVEGKFLKPVSEFKGEFGMPNLNKLKILLNLPEYKDSAKLTLSHKEVDYPDSIHFENAAGDFRNSYRFMAREVVEERLRVPKFKGVQWHVEFEPSLVAIQRLKMQAQAHSEESTFQAKTNNGNLEFHFGSHATHAGDFVFHHGAGGKLSRTWSWPIKTLISILDLTGDKVYRISDDGATMITVNTGLAEYNYILPAHT